jgi:hypothetical protein
MEYDITLKHILANDNFIMKKEVDYSLQYLQCKVTQCYKGNKYTHIEFEECKEKCMEKLNKFNLLKELLYQDYTKFYYNKFLSCVGNQHYENCTDEAKKDMKRNIDDIKKIVINYNFN